MVLLKKDLIINNNKNIQNKYIKIFDRSLIINEFCLNKKFAVYNGKKFVPIKITEMMLGKKFGDFSFTRKIYLQKKRKSRR